MALCNADNYRDEFETVALFDNVEMQTIMLKQVVWEQPATNVFIKDFQQYCAKRHIYYCLYPERGQNGNLHYHGIIGYPSNQIRKRMQTWINKYYGKVFTSEKDDPSGWMSYCIKNQPRPPSPDYVDHRHLNLFDKIHEQVY